MSLPIPLTSNVAAALVPISEEEMALLADEQRVQQETDDLKCLLAAKHKQCEELADKQKAAQTKCEEETKVRARALMEAAVAEVRQDTKHANECTKDAARKVNEELQRMQSPAKEKHRLVHHIISSGGEGTETSVGECYAGEGESHASKGKGFASGHEEWQYEMEGERVVPVRWFHCLADPFARNQRIPPVICVTIA